MIQNDISTARQACEAPALRESGTLRPGRRLVTPRSVPPLRHPLRLWHAGQRPRRRCCRPRWSAGLSFAGQQQQDSPLGASFSGKLAEHALPARVAEHTADRLAVAVAVDNPGIYV